MTLTEHQTHVPHETRAFQELGNFVDFQGLRGCKNPPRMEIAVKPWSKSNMIGDMSSGALDVICLNAHKKLASQ